MIVPKTTFAVLALLYGAEAARVYSLDATNTASASVPQKTDNAVKTNTDEKDDINNAIADAKT